MAKIDRLLYKGPFQKFTRYPCPTCGKGTLQIKKDTFQRRETNESEMLRGHENWDPQWVSYVYSCLLECSSCKDSIANTGDGFVDLDVEYDDEGVPDQEWRDFFRPKYFSPHLKIFTYPKETPDDVKKEIEQSFELFFCSSASSLNHLRIALEYLLTFLKIKRFEKTPKGKRLFLSLHRRIEMLPSKHNNLKELLVAIKWLGNAGSHNSTEITMDDVLDAYEIMALVLKQVLSSDEAHVKKMVKEINKKKGPRKK